MKIGQPNTKKEVIVVYINKEFNRFIKKSEIKTLLDIMETNKGIIGIELAKIPKHQLSF